MKKTAIALLALTNCVINFFAQDAKKFHFGLKASPGIYWMKTSDKQVASNGAKFGFSYGLMLDFGLTDNYGIATGFEVATLGVKYTQDADSASTPIVYSYDNKLQYIQLPVTLKMKTKDIGGIKYFGQFGLGTGINYKSTSDYTKKVGSGNKIDYSDIDVKKKINPIRLALIVGGGIEYNLSGSTSLLIGARYDNGFLSINKSSGPKIFSKGIIVDIGVLF